MELLLCEPLEGGLGRRWRAIGQASKPIRAGAVLAFDGLEARVEASEGEGFYVVTLDREGAALEAALARAGPDPAAAVHPPRARPTEDRERYQTDLGARARQRRRAHRRAALHRGGPRAARGARRRAGPP